MNTEQSRSIMPNPFWSNRQFEFFPLGKSIENLFHVIEILILDTFFPFHFKNHSNWRIWIKAI